ncbi:MAG: sugar ABC transporter substrate-binding protein [Verrucomicrobia bacterium]|nr:sugar ABC transporter substrate-binding protein [Verrucomicrobiota bacterium]
MKSRVLDDLLKIALSLSVFAIIQPALAQNKHYRIGFVVGDVGNPFHTRVWKTAKTTAAANNIDLIILDTKRDLATESSNIDQLISQHPDLIMVMPTSAEGSVAGLDRIIEAKIPLMTVLDSASGSGTKYRYVGSDFEDWGQLQIGHLAQLLNGKGNIVYIKGAAGFLIEHLRDSFTKKALKDYPDIHVVFEQNGDWNKPSGVTIMEDALARSPAPNSIQAVIAHNDNMVLGAIEALKRANRLNQVVTGGSDGNADALQSMLAGELTYSIFQNGEEIGEKSISTALDVLNGKNPPMLVGVQLKLIDNKEMAKEYLKKVYGIE